MRQSRETVNKEIGLLGPASVLPARDLAFIAEACDIQMRRDFCPAWGLEPWPVVPFTEIPPDEEGGGTNPIFMMAEIGIPSALGYHTASRDGVTVYGRVLKQTFHDMAITASHECLEMRADPLCDTWWPGRSKGELVAAEVCDPVQGDWYTIDVKIGTETRKVPVCNFVTMAWATGGPGPYDHMGRVRDPLSMTPGGYLITRNPDGTTSNVFASEAPASARFAAQGKVRDPMARTGRRHGAALGKALAEAEWLPR